MTGNPFDELNHTLCQTMGQSFTHSDSSKVNQITGTHVVDHADDMVKMVNDTMVNSGGDATHNSGYNVFYSQSNDHQCEMNVTQHAFIDHRERYTDSDQLSSIGKAFDCVYLNEHNHSLMDTSGGGKTIDLTNTVNDKVASLDNCRIIDAPSIVRPSAVPTAPFNGGSVGGVGGAFLYDKHMVTATASTVGNSMIYPMSTVMANDLIPLKSKASDHTPVKKSHCKIVTFQEPISVNYPVDKIHDHGTHDKGDTGGVSNVMATNEHDSVYSGTSNTAGVSGTSFGNSPSSWLNFSVNAFVAASNLHSIVTRISSGNNHHHTNHVCNDDMSSTGADDM